MLSMSNLLEQLCFLHEVNTNFFEFLDSTTVLGKLSFLNSKFRKDLPLQVQSLRLQCGQLRMLQDKFPRVEKLFLLPNMSLVKSIYSTQISHQQFPNLHEVHCESAYIKNALIIEKEIALTKLYIQGNSTSCLLDIPVNSLREFSFIASRDETLLSCMLEEFLDPKIRPPLEKLEIGTANISSLEKVSKILYKFGSTLRKVCIRNLGDFEYHVDKVCKLDHEIFPKLEIFEYYDKYYDTSNNSVVHIIDSQSITQLSLNNEHLECLKCSPCSIFPNLKKLELFGSDTEIATFLQSLGRPLSQCAPNLESLDVFIIGNQSLSFSTHTILRSNLFDCLWNETRFLFLRTLSLQFNIFSFAISLYRLPSLKNFKFVSYQNVKDDGQVFIQECTTLEQLFLANVPKCLLRDLARLETLHYTTENDQRKVNIRHMNSPNLRKLIFDIRNTNICKEFTKFFCSRNFKNLNLLKLNIFFRDKNMATVFLHTILSTELLKLKDLEIRTPGDVSINGLVELQTFFLISDTNNRIQSYVANCPMLIKLSIIGTLPKIKSKFLVSNLPKLQNMQIQLSPIPKSMYKIPLYVSNLPSCTKIQCNDYIKPLVERKCPAVIEKCTSVLGW